MTAVEDGCELETRIAESDCDGGLDATEEVPAEVEWPEERAPRVRLPWIGALPNPHVGAMVVLNDNGYLVPLCTAGDLLRGCKYYWRAAQD